MFVEIFLFVYDTFLMLRMIRYVDTCLFKSPLGDLDARDVFYHVMDEFLT